MDGSDVSAQEPSEFPLVSGMGSRAVGAIALTFLNHELTFVGPLVVVGRLVARHVGDVKLYCS